MPHEISSPDIALAIENGMGTTGWVLTSQGPGLDFIWQPGTTATGGITQPQADARYVQLSGAAPMTGPLILYADPTAAHGAATKAYVDAMAAAFQGITQGQADARYVQLTGAVAMSGTLILGADPVLPLGAATKNYVDTHAAASAPVQSVAGKQGTVTLQHTDITDWTAATANLGLVQSVAGRTGNVVLGTADIAGFNTGAALAAPVQTVSGRTGAITLTPADIIGFGTVAAAAAPVQSVAGRIGAIVLSAADITNFNAAAAAAAPVTSVATRTGAVVLQHTDITDWATATANLGKVTSVAGKIGDVTLVPTDIVGFGTAAAAAAPVTSVAGRIGAIVLSAADISNFNSAAAAAAPVTSVAGKTGAVALVPTDIANFNATAAGAAPVQTVSGRQGAITLTHTDITDWAASTVNFGLVQSVAGKQGAVILGTADIIGFAPGAAAAAPVQTVSGRTGNVTIMASDVVGLAGSIATVAPVRTVAGKIGDVILVAADVTDFSPAAAAAAPVKTVAGKTGAVTLVAADITNFNTAALQAAPVQTVAGRTGNVVISATDVAGLNAAASIAAPVQTVAGRIGAIILSAADISNFNSAAAATAPVRTVAGRAGDILLTHSDVTDWAAATATFGLVTSVAAKVGNITLFPTDITNFTTAAAAAAPVQSVGGRTGSIVLNHLDVTDWASATAQFGQWNAGAVGVLGNSLVLSGNTLNTAGGSAQHFVGNYNPVTNTPSLGAGGTGVGGGVNGNTYVISAAGTVAFDGVGVVAPPDQLTNNGSLWVRNPVSAALGSLAAQNANAVAISNGNISATLTALGTLTINNAGNIYSIIPGSVGGEANTDAYGAFGWGYDPFANLLMAGSVIAGNGISLSPTGWAAGAAKFTVGSGGYMFIDQYGATGGGMDASGNMAIGGSLTGNGFTLSAAGVTGPAAGTIVNWSTTTNQPDSVVGLVLVDRYGAVGLVADPAAMPIAYTNSLPPTTYSAGDLQRRDAAALANSNANQGMQSPYAQKPIFGANFWMVYGQSQSVGAVGSPALTKTQPTDALMFGPYGISSQGGIIGTGTVWVSPDNNFHPAIGTDQPVGLLHTGVIPNLGTVSIAGGASSGTITQTGGSTVAWNSVFVVTDYFGMTGWPAPNTALNNDTSPRPDLCIGTVTAITANSLTFTIGAGITIQPATGATSVSLQQISHAGDGERQEIEAITLYRKLSLDTKQLPADPTRLVVSAATGHGGQYIEQLRPQPSVRNWQCYITQSLTGQVDAVDTNAGQMTITGVTSIQDLTGNHYVNGVDYTVSGPNITWVNPRPAGRKYIANVTFTNQNSFGIPVTAAQAFKATATSLGATSGVFMITYWQGTTDGGNTTYAGYKASLAGLINDFEVQVTAGVFGQGRSPVYLIIGDSSTNLTEPLGLINDPKGMCVAQADLDTALNPPIPTVYLLGGTYAMPRIGFHLFSNGYRWLGALVGKVSHLIIDLGVSWRPLHMTQATYRGNTVVIDFYVPVPPLQIQPFFLGPGGTPTVWPDWGFLVIDAVGVVPILSVALNGQATVVLTLGRTPTGSAIVRYADQANHTGAGNICDSDPAVADVGWVYQPGNGQWPAENAPGWNGKAFPLWNWCCNAAVPLTSS